jgi:hypothetical protein
VRLHLHISVPYSGGTSLEANFSAPFGGMSIDFSFMDEIVALHEDESVKLPHSRPPSFTDSIHTVWMLSSSLLCLG